MTTAPATPALAERLARVVGPDHVLADLEDRLGHAVVPVGLCRRPV